MNKSERTLLLAILIAPARTAAKLSPEAERLVELDYVTDADGRLTITVKGRAALAATRKPAGKEPDALLTGLSGEQKERFARAVLGRPLRKDPT